MAAVSVAPAVVFVAPVVASVVSAAFVACAFDTIAVSAPGVAGPLAAFSLQQPSVSPAADDHCPASAGVSADPGSVSRSVFPAASGIAGPASSSPF